MHGDGTAVIRMVMIPRDKLQAIMLDGKHYIAIQYKKWFPYGAILIFLTGICFFGNNNSIDPIRQTTGEVKHSENVSSPVFVSQEQKTRKEQTSSEKHYKNEGISGTESVDLAICVYDVSAVRRNRHMPDLFEKHIQQLEKTVIGQIEEKKVEKPQEKISHELFPRYCGFMECSGRRLVLLKSGKDTRPCAVGDQIAGCIVMYINVNAIGLKKEGKLIEIRL
jgi:hypothetical protein